MPALHVLLSGRVQGVSYRAWAKKEADELKLTGWVRNLADGRVEAVLQGDDEHLYTMLEKMRRGPLFAHVKDMLPAERPEEEFTEFKIRRTV